MGLNTGLIKEVARYFFNLKVDMIRIATQDVDGSQFTSWRIIIRGPYEEERDTMSKGGSSSRSLSEDSCKVADDANASAKDSARDSIKCPFGY